MLRIFLLISFSGLVFLQADAQVLPEEYPLPPKPNYGPNDTILVRAELIEGEWMGGRELAEIIIWGGDPRAWAKQQEEWTRLRNAVYVTYPYAKAGGAVFNEVSGLLQHVTNKQERRKIIKSREKQLKERFADKITGLSVYQGKVLMKLLNRETNNTCYDIIKEMKGGLSARFWQTIAFFFGGDLKQPWSPRTDKTDQKIELIVREVERMYYHGTAMNQP